MTLGARLSFGKPDDKQWLSTGNDGADKMMMRLSEGGRHMSGKESGEWWNPSSTRSVDHDEGGMGNYERFSSNMENPSGGNVFGLRTKRFGSHSKGTDTDGIQGDVWGDNEFERFKGHLMSSEFEDEDKCSLKSDGSGKLFGLEKQGSTNPGRFPFSGDRVFAPKPAPGMKVPSSGILGSKFKIICINDLKTERQGDVCFGLIGHGPTFCIRKNCKTTHTGGTFDVNNNAICVIKMNDISLFCEPTLLSEQVDQTLLETWKSETLTLDEWTEHVGFAKASKDLVTDDKLKASEALKEAANEFKTPLKSTQKASDTEIQEMLALLPTEEIYKRKVTGPSEVEKVKTNDPVFLTKVIQGIEEKLEAATQNTMMINAEAEQVPKRVKLELPILFSKASSLDATIGKQMKNKVSEYVAPTVWSSIALLTTLYRDTQCQVQDFPRLANVMRYDVTKEMDQKIDQTISRKLTSSSEDALGKLGDLKNLVVSSLEQIGNCFQYKTSRSDEVRAKVVSMVRNQQGVSSQGNFSASYFKDYADDQINVVREAMSEMNRKIDDRIADTHQDAIKFNGFGFRQYEEAAVWLETHSPKRKFGLIVDVHMVVEHLYSSAEKTVPALQHLKKIDMTDISQGVAVSSFDQLIPKLLCDGTNYGVVQTDESYFD
jgi:hypothetical protein